jgi:glycosyltransferase involved in cell wall biosynthesis
VVTTFHDLKPPFLFPKAGPLRVWVVQQLARHSGAVVVTNAEDMAVARRWFPARPLGAPTVHQIPIGSNIPVSPPLDYNRNEWRARLGYAETDFVWAYFGFLNESKGGETLFRALAGAPDTHRLLMIGGRVGTSDPTNRTYAERVETLMGDLGIVDRVRWTGYVPTEQVSAALLGSDVVVLPYRDGISFRRGSLHAALAHGCSVISTRPAVPLPELNEGDNCLLVPPQDPQALHRAAERLAGEPTLHRRIGEGARTLAKQFTWQHIARRTVDEAFEPLVGAGRKR